jgi:hypothetical protein
MRIYALRTMVRVVRAVLRDLEEELREEEAGGSKEEKPEPRTVGSNKQKKVMLGAAKQPKEEPAIQATTMPEKAAHGEVCAGARVVVKVRDRYYGRYGTVIGKKGNYFWDIKLDAAAEKPACVIYKKTASLIVVE